MSKEAKKNVSANEVTEDTPWSTEDPIAVARRKMKPQLGPFSRREFLAKGAATVGGLAVLGLAGCKKSADDFPKPLTQSKTLTSGYIPIVDSIPIPIAYEKGFFQEFGLKADKPVLIRGWAPLLEAFISDQILLTHILLFQVIFMRYEQNLPIRSIAFNHQNGVALLGGPGVTAFEQLGGTVVGCPTWWAPHTLLMQENLRAVGLKPVVNKPGQDLKTDEVAFRVISPPDMPNALLTGAISGAVVSEGFGALSEMLANSTLLRMSGDIWRNHPCCQSVMMQYTMDQDRSWAQAVTLAIAKACQWCEENREEMAEILSKDGAGYFPQPKNILERGCNYTSLEEYGVETGTGAIRHPEWNVKRLGFNPFPYPSAFELAVSLMKNNVVDDAVGLTEQLRSLDPKQAATEIVDYEFIREAITQIGGIEQFIEGENVNPDNPFEREEQFEV